jgi:aspartyl protease family protein
VQKAFVFVVLIGLALGWMWPTGETSPPATVAVASVGGGAARSGTAALPSRPPAETLLKRAGNGHFMVNAEVNAQLVHFVVDTGATSVALTVDDAERIGIPFSPAEFEVIGSGASGPVRGKQLTFDSVSIEGKEVRGVRGAIIEGADISLLGQSYLSRIGSVEMSGDYMRLR